MESAFDGAAAPEGAGAGKKFVAAPSARILNPILKRTVVSWGLQTSKLLSSEAISSSLTATDTVTALGTGMSVLKASVQCEVIVVGAQLPFGFKLAISLRKAVMSAMNSGLTEFCASQRVMRSRQRVFSPYTCSSFCLIA